MYTHITHTPALMHVYTHYTHTHVRTHKDTNVNTYWERTRTDVCIVHSTCKQEITCSASTRKYTASFQNQATQGRTGLEVRLQHYYTWHCVLQHYYIWHYVLQNYYIWHCVLQCYYIWYCVLQRYYIWRCVLLFSTVLQPAHQAEREQRGGVSQSVKKASLSLAILPAASNTRLATPD